MKAPPELAPTNIEAIVEGMADGGLLPEGGFYTPPPTKKPDK